METTKSDFLKPLNMREIQWISAATQQNTSFGVALTTIVGNFA